MASLYDMMLRHSLYLEGAKKGTADEFSSSVVSDLDAVVKRAFQNINVDNFGEFTKADFNRFVADIRLRTNNVHNQNTKELMNDTKKLSRVETTLFQGMFREDTGDRLATPSNVWGSVKNSNIPATGQTFQKSANTFRNSSVGNIERLLRNGYADKLDTTDVFKSIRGVKSLGYKDGVFGKISGWGRTLANTLMSHTSSSVKDKIAPSYYDEYQWVSVLDDVTTEICWERDGEIYKMGEGPQPPAHYNCRSMTVPISPSREDIEEPDTLAEWLDGQPSEVLKDIFGDVDPSLDNVKVISLDQFKDKLDIILI